MFLIGSKISGTFVGSFVVTYREHLLQHSYNFRTSTNWIPWLLSSLMLKTFVDEHCSNRDENYEQNEMKLIVLMVNTSV